MAYRILALDGGGVRGAFTITLLERLTQEPGLAEWIQRADLIAGTSTGGILAMGLAAGYSPTFLREFYQTETRGMFKPPAALQWWPFRRWTVVPQLFHALYVTRNMKAALERVVGDRRLSDLSQRVVIPAYSLFDERQGRWRPKIFHNFPEHAWQKSDRSERLVDVALRSSAAPTYFPTYDNYVDGGVAANNPSMCALAQALNPETGRQKLEDIVMLSVGTGQTQQFIRESNAPWGAMRWLFNQPRLTDLLVEGNVDIAFYQTRQILRDRLHRLNPPLDANYALDDSERVADIVAAGRQAALQDETWKDRAPENTAAWLRRHWV